LHKRRNTLVKERILPSLRIAATIIKTETTIETTGIVTETTTKTTETLVAVEHIDNLIATADLGDVAISARKKTANYGNIQRKSGQERRRPTRASSTTALRNALSSTSSTAKATTART
jgi:hypothetical protein